MIKFVKTIVNTQRSLIGFIAEGKEREFGGMSNNKVVQALTTKELINRKFSNNQLMITNGKIVERNNFKINQLPMCVFTGDNYVDIDNSITLTGRFLQNNENIGFEATFADGSKLNYNYANIIMLCNWFKPSNFIIRTSSTGKKFISGKQGCMKLEDLPVTVLGEAPTAKRTKSAAKEMDKNFSGALPSGFDILDVIEFIDSCGGAIIKLPSEGYIGKTPEGKENEDAAGFKSLGIGEVASAKPMYNASKLNVNAGFKKVGVVRLNMMGTEIPLTTFIYRTKSLFYNGENHIKKFGIAIPSDKEEQLVKVLGASLALNKVTDESFTKPLGQVIDVESLAFYTVDTSKLDLISDKKRTSGILTSDELAKLMQERFKYNILTKFANPKTGVLKEIEKNYGTAFVKDAEGKKPFGIFATMSDTYLEKIAELGIDVYTGAFNVAKAAGDSFKSGSSASDPDEVVIEYVLKDYDPKKYTYKQIVEIANKYIETGSTDTVFQDIIHYIAKVMSEENIENKVKLARELNKMANAKLDETTKKLWIHNASMYLSGNKSKIHVHDKNDWVLNEKSRVKTGKAYVNKKVPGLAVKINNVDIE